jgi:hypothetical protein
MKPNKYEDESCGGVALTKETNYHDNGLIYRIRFCIKGTSNLHHADMPALFLFDINEKMEHFGWYFNNKFHKKDAPARWWNYGLEEWAFDGLYHRVKGPAIDYSKCAEDKKLHSYNKWRRHNKCHRLNAPAVLGFEKNPHKEFWEFGEFIK